MVEIADEVIGGSESIGLVADHLGLVIEPFDRAVIDGHVKSRQDVFLMATGSIRYLCAKSAQFRSA